MFSFYVHLICVTYIRRHFYAVSFTGIAWKCLRECMHSIISMATLALISVRFGQHRRTTIVELLCAPAPATALSRILLCRMRQHLWRLRSNFVAINFVGIRRNLIAYMINLWSTWQAVLCFMWPILHWDYAGFSLNSHAQSFSGVVEPCYIVRF